MSVTSNVLNKVMLMGHLGQAPMVKHFESGSTMASFTLATNESYTNSVGKRIENTQWHKLVAWGDVAKAIEQDLTKGTKIALTGKISNRQYEAKDGTKKYTTEIVVYEYELISAENKVAA